MSDTDELDSGTVLNFFARLELHLSRLHDAVRANAHRPAPIPLDVRIPKSSTIPASGIDYIDLGAPPQGQRWLVRSIVVGGLTQATAALGQADVYVSASKPTSLSLADWHDSTGTGNTLPAIAFYDGRNLVVMPPEHLYIVITNGTPTQQYLTCASIEQYTEAAYDKMFPL